MSYAIGAQVPLEVQITDSSGALVDAATVTIVVTKPSGATDTYTLAGGGVTRLSVGTYITYYAPTLRGLHSWVASSTGPATARPPDSFYVVDSPDAPLVGLAEVRQELRAFGSASDDDLLGWALMASDACERYTDRVWVRKTITAEQHQGGSDVIQLQRGPVQSITSVTEEGTVVAAASYVLDPFDVLRRVSGVWLWRTAPVLVTYVAGPDSGLVPDGIRRGALEMCRHLAMVKRGGSGRPAQPGDDSPLPGSLHAIPWRVQEFWDLHRRF